MNNPELALKLVMQKMSKKKFLPPVTLDDELAKQEEIEERWRKNNKSSADELKPIDYQALREKMGRLD